MKSLQKLLILVSSISILLVLTTAIAIADELDVKDGRECQRVAINGFPTLDRLYVWTEAGDKLIHFRCVRNDTKKLKDGSSWSCGNKVAKKFLVPNKGPKCVWKKTINSKTKKPSEYDMNFNAGESCLDKDGYAVDDFLVYVKNRNLVALRCDNGVWIEPANSQESNRGPSSQSSGNSGGVNSKNLKNACANFADSLIAYDRTSRYATSLYEMQLATRRLTQASSSLQDLARLDKTLAPLNTSIGILLRHVQSKAPGGSGTPVNSDVLRMAADSFNAFCGTSIYVTP